MPWAKVLAFLKSRRELRNVSTLTFRVSVPYVSQITPVQQRNWRLTVSVFLSTLPLTALQQKSFRSTSIATQQCVPYRLESKLYSLVYSRRDLASSRDARKQSPPPQASYSEGDLASSRNAQKQSPPPQASYSEGDLASSRNARKQSPSQQASEASYSEGDFAFTVSQYRMCAWSVCTIQTLLFSILFLILQT